jgi:hypothetical protein
MEVLLFIAQTPVPRKWGAFDDETVPLSAVLGNFVAGRNRRFSQIIARTKKICGNLRHLRFKCLAPKGVWDRGGKW